MHHRRAGKACLSQAAEHLDPHGDIADAAHGVDRQAHAPGCKARPGLPARPARARPITCSPGLHAIVYHAHDAVAPRRAQQVDQRFAVPAAAVDQDGGRVEGAGRDVQVLALWLFWMASRTMASVISAPAGKRSRSRRVLARQRQGWLGDAPVSGRRWRRAMPPHAAGDSSAVSAIVAQRFPGWHCLPLLEAPPYHDILLSGASTSRVDLVVSSVQSTSPGATG